MNTPNCNIDGTPSMGDFFYTGFNDAQPTAAWWTGEVFKARRPNSVLSGSIGTTRPRARQWYRDSWFGKGAI